MAAFVFHQSSKSLLLVLFRSGLLRGLSPWYLQDKGLTFGIVRAIIRSELDRDPEHRHDQRCLATVRLFVEKFHEQLPLPVPCYDLILVTELALGPQCETSGTPGSPDLTGGEYKTRERIHRSIADLRLLAIPTS